MSRDITLADTIYILFTTRAFATGIPTVLAGTPVVSAYENDSATQITAGITLGVDHDSVVGLNLLTIVATGANGYEAGKDYSLVITTGTVDSVSVVGEVVGEFQMGRAAAAVDLANGTDGLGAIKADSAAILIDTADMQPKLGTPASDLAADVAAVKVDTAATLVDTADIQPKIGTPASDVSADIAAVKTETALIVADTNELQVDNVPGLIAALNDLTAAQVNAEADTALSDYDAPTKAEMDTAHALLSTPAQVNTEVDNALNTAIPGGPTADSINQRVLAIDDLSQAGGDGDLGAILLDTIEIGAAGVGLTAIPWNAAWDAEVQSEVNDALIALGLDHLVNAAVVGADVADNSIFAYLVSSAATADWDSFVNTTEALQALRDRGDSAWTTGAGGTPPTTLQSTTIATLASQVSFTLTAGSADDLAYAKMLCIVTDAVTGVQKAVGIISVYTGATRTVTLREDPGVFTMAVGDTVDIVAISPDLLDVLADVTGIAGAAMRGTDSAALASVATEARLAELDAANLPADIDLILADTGELQTDWVDGGRLDLLIDLIKTEVDKLDAAQTEPTGVPAANATPITKLAFLFMGLRNRIEITATEKSFYDDGGAVEYKKLTTDDSTTYSEAEAVAP